MADLSTSFRDFLGLLNSHGVRYLVVGGYAMAVHGHARYTKDIDLWLDRSAENAGKMVAVLEEFGFGSLGLKAADFEEDDCIIQLGREPNRIDLLTRLSGLDFSSCYGDCVRVEIAGLTLPFLDRQSLITNKRAVGRPQDLLDAKELDETPDRLDGS